MAWKKNADGVQQYYHRTQKTVQKIIQKDWFKEHKYKQDTYDPEFFENVEKTITPTKRGYWAYAIDGDGWIHIHKRKSGVCNFETGIKLKDREPIQELADIYGASISRIDASNENWKPLYIVKIYGKRARHFLRLICPYMTEKRKKATQVLNKFDPNYHPPKISMDFRKHPDLINPHMGMIAGFFDTEGSVGLKIDNKKYKTKKFGNRVCTFLNSWVNFSNSDLRPLRKIKKILETYPFNFKPAIYMHKTTCIGKDGTRNKNKYRLHIPSKEELLFMKMFAPWILITRKSEYADKFERKKQIYKLCDERERH